MWTTYLVVEESSPHSHELRTRFPDPFKGIVDTTSLDMDGSTILCCCCHTNLLVHESPEHDRRPCIHGTEHKSSTVTRLDSDPKPVGLEEPFKSGMR